MIKNLKPIPCVKIKSYTCPHSMTINHVVKYTHNMIYILHRIVIDVIETKVRNILQSELKHVKKNAI